MAQVQITAKEIASKMRSKEEAYRFLADDVKAFLPNHKTVTIWFLRDIIQGTKKHIKMSNASHIHLPQFEGLTMEDLMGYARQFPEVMIRLPPEKEIEKLPRDYVGDVIVSIIGDPFVKWKEERIAARNKKIAEKQNQNCGMDPEIAAAFRASTSISGKFL